MININNNIQIPLITKNKSMNIGSPSNTNDNLFNELVEEIQKKTSTNNEINTVSGNEDDNSGLSRAETRSNNVYNGQYTEKGTKIVQPGEDMNKDAFLRILATQMSNQDPTQPQDGTEYVSQFAQFAAMEQMSNLNTTMSEYSARSLLGQGVMLNSYDNNGNAITGIVRGVAQSGSKIIVNVEYMNDKGEFVIGDFERDDVMNVIDVQDNRLDYINNNMAMLVGSSIINKEIEFISSSNDEEFEDDVITNESESGVDDSVNEEGDMDELEAILEQDIQAGRKANGETVTYENNGQLYETMIGRVEGIVVEDYMIKLSVRVNTTNELRTVTLDKVIRVDGKEYID